MAKGGLSVQLLTIKGGRGEQIPSYQHSSWLPPPSSGTKQIPAPYYSWPARLAFPEFGHHIHSEGEQGRLALPSL